MPYHPLHVPKPLLHKRRFIPLTIQTVNYPNKIQSTTPKQACSPLLPSRTLVLQSPDRTPLPLNLPKPATWLRLQSRKPLMPRRALLSVIAVLVAEAPLRRRRRRREIIIMLLLVRARLVLICFVADDAECEVGDLGESQVGANKGTEGGNVQRNIQTPR